MKRSITPPPTPPKGFDPEDRSWHGYKRTWRSQAMWVDLRPMRVKLLHWAHVRAGRAKMHDAAGSDQHELEMGPTEQKHAVGLVGEIAAALLLGAPRPTIEESNDPDLTMPSGDRYEVKTSSMYLGAKFKPSMLANKRGRHAWKNEQFPTIWCITQRYPSCFDGAFVVGWIEPETFMQRRQHGDGKIHWAWVLDWVDDGRWLHPGLIMQDELAQPRLPVGMPLRRTDDDPGIPEYMDALRSAAAGPSVEPPPEPLSETP